jgi:cobalamin biosynthesis protein CobD/CbiB
MAGTLGVELEKVGHYRLGAPAALPTPAMIRRSVRLVYVMVALLIGACVLGEVGHHATHRR